MNHIHKILKSVCDPASVLDTVTTFEKFTAADAQLDRESGSHSSADRLKYLTDNPYPVLKTAAILISSMIEVRRQELVEQPSVAGVHHNHFITCTFGNYCSITISLDDVSNLLFRERLYRAAVRTRTLAWSPLAQAFLLVLVSKICTGILSRMREFDARHCTVSADCVCNECMCREASRCCKVKVKHMAGVRLRMHDEFADRNRTSSSLCPQLIKSLSTWARIAFRGNVGSTHRSRKDSIAEIHIAKSDRTGKIRILIGIHMVSQCD